MRCPRLSAPQSQGIVAAGQSPSGLVGDQQVMGFTSQLLQQQGVNLLVGGSEPVPGAVVDHSGEPAPRADGRVPGLAGLANRWDSSVVAAPSGGEPDQTASINASLDTGWLARINNAARMAETRCPRTGCDTAWRSIASVPRSR